MKGGKFKLSAADKICLLVAISNVFRIALLANCRLAYFMDPHSLTSTQIASYVQTNIILEFISYVSGALCSNVFMAGVVSSATGINMFADIKFGDTVVSPDKILKIFRLVNLIISLVFCVGWCTVGVSTSLTYYTLFRRGTFLLSIASCVFVAIPVLWYFGNKVISKLMISSKGAGISNDKKPTSNTAEDSSISQPPSVKNNRDTKIANFKWAMNMTLWLLYVFNIFNASFALLTYDYDLPAALNSELMSWLNSTYSDYQIQLNLLYSAYSLPNIALPFVGGLLMDKMGTNLMIILFASLVCIGQGVLTYGVADKNFNFMLVGRFIFGFGAECLDVGQSDIVTKWFRGHGMAFAFGLNFTVARLFTTFSDNFSSRFADAAGINFSMKVGLIICVAGIVSAMLISQLYRLAPGEVVSRNPTLQRRPSTLGGAHSRNPSNLSQKQGHKRGESNTSQKQGHKKAPILSIPDLISAVGSPLCGVLVDYYGHRSQIIIVSGVCFLAAHFILAFSTISPLVGMSLIGVGYSLFASTLWAYIPVFVSDEQVGTAFGIISSVLNIGLFVFPIIIGWIRSTSDPSNYLPTQYFFMALCFVALIAAIALIPYESNAMDQSKVNLLNPSLITEDDKVEEYVITSLGRAPTRVLVKVGEKLKTRKTAHVAKIQSNTDIKVILHEQRKSIVSPRGGMSFDSPAVPSLPEKWKSSKSKGSIASVDIDPNSSFIKSVSAKSPKGTKPPALIPEEKGIDEPNSPVSPKSPKSPLSPKSAKSLTFKDGPGEVDQNKHKRPNDPEKCFSFVGVQESFQTRNLEEIANNSDTKLKVSKSTESLNDKTTRKSGNSEKIQTKHPYAIEESSNPQPIASNKSLNKSSESLADKRKGGLGKDL
ncbi:hypothetical protein HDV06_003686 [Boothiomyces sp. JEL0866]|nr:hypothetical protein HDV06_003686 [Boothiomyces sp. JEL0866]